MTFYSPGSPRLPLAALALLLAACGDDTGDSASATAANSSSTGNTTGGTTPTPTSVDPTGATDEPTAGSMSQSGTSDSTTETTAVTSSTSTTATSQTSSTTEPVQTDTGPDDTGNTTLVGTTVADSTSGTSTTGDESSSSTGDTNNVEPCACPDLEVKLDDGIFVLSDNSHLWKFYPETKMFEELGAFNCGGMTNTFSMAVDRLGYAWVMFNNPQGEIWKLDVTNVGNCVDPGYNPGQMGVNYFGMAYVSNSAEDVCDHLYGNTFNGIGGFSEGPGIGSFITVDTDTQLLKKLGPTDFNGAEVTGTGDGRAFLFGGVNPSKLVEVDKTNGKFLEVTPLPGLNLTNAFAFAFFAGDFYLFTESNNPTFSKVTHFDYDDSDMNGKQDLTTVVAQAPMRIVGAGVSTCAPFAPQ